MGNHNTKIETSFLIITNLLNISNTASIVHNIVGTNGHNFISRKNKFCDNIILYQTVPNSSIQDIITLKLKKEKELMKNEKTVKELIQRTAAQLKSTIILLDIVIKKTNIQPVGSQKNNGENYPKKTKNIQHSYNY